MLVADHGRAVCQDRVFNGRAARLGLNATERGRTYEDDGNLGSHGDDLLEFDGRLG